MEIQDLINGSKITINGFEFTLSIEDSMSGDIAVWRSEKYIILATPNYEDIPIPVDIYTIDYMSIGTECSFKDVETFEEYCNEVKETAEMIFKEVV